MHSCHSQVVVQLIVLNSQKKTDSHDTRQASWIFVDGAEFYNVALKFHDSSAILEICDIVRRLPGQSCEQYVILTSYRGLHFARYTLYLLLVWERYLNMKYCIGEVP